MTPANSTSFAANGADSSLTVEGFNVSVGGLSSGGDGFSSDFLARHTTDSRFTPQNDSLNRYTASAVDPVLSIPVREDFAHTHLQWRCASEPAEDDGSPGASGAVGDVAKIITNADNLAASACGSVSSCDISLEKLVHLRDENRVTSEGGEAKETIAVASGPAYLPNGSRCFHNAGLEVSVSRQKETINAEIVQNERVLSGQTRQDQAHAQSPVETQRAEAVPPATDAESERLCRHYCRRCYVQFSCCSEFFACHWCHNDSGKCDNTTAIASNATHLKCAECQVVQLINEDSHHCSNCTIAFADYFCARCKHFASVDKKPFHCEKCGICRYHKDRNFHCDVCNVCLDKSLEGKHGCRPDSGHDECCICFEDAFSGCHVLPCSHKVHELCGRAMVQNEISNCPMCRHPFFLNSTTD